MKSPVAGSLPKQPTTGGPAAFFLRQNMGLAAGYTKAFNRRRTGVGLFAYSFPPPNLSPMLAGQFVLRKKPIGNG